MFGRKRSEPEPVRRDQVMKLISLGMKETDAADRGIDAPEFDGAKAAFDAALGKATQAEKAAAFKALKRHGY
ncbi:hypothetical protein D7147_04190 [Micromonospora musae]|uniref:Uncharacterized protein n=1 Tax=Micromonospora musae TaxID=1894970 RepID=A0ABX9RJV5_9ACTN|nr:hypothetical protein [Micromonospora musae]RKN24191.1 hypothetical protein D7147_04190 [Micromonospora musae]